MESNKPEDGGRGLDQVSNLLLSAQIAERALRERYRNVSEPQGQPAQKSQPSTVVLHASRSIARDQLLSLLQQQPAALEEGMRMLDVNLPCETQGNLELLALDSANQLAIVEVDDKANDGLLLRGVAHLDWTVRNSPLLRRM